MVFLFRLLSLLPLSLLHALGGALGRLVYWLSPTYRRHLRENMAQAGIDVALRGAVAAETGKQMIELARIWMRPLDEAVPLVAEVTGWEHVEAARAAGRGRPSTGTSTGGSPARSGPATIKIARAMAETPGRNGMLI